jgi:hypothetical protein
VPSNGLAFFLGWPPLPRLNAEIIAKTPQHHQQVNTQKLLMKKLCLILFVALFALSWHLVAAPSGLNNIPTADTAPHLALVIQEYTTFGANRKPDHLAGFKFGVDPWQESEWRNRFEWGLDGRLGSGDAGPAFFHGKFATQPRPDLPALGLGVANLAVTEPNRERGGQPFSYAVLTHDLNWFRLHGGYGWQTHNNDSALLGIDRTWKVFERDLMLRADAIQIEQQHNWAASIGGLYAFHKYFVFETWMTQPIHNSPPTFTLKFNLVIPFADFIKN